MITPWESQKTKSAQAFEVLSKHGLVYLAMEERTGKSLTALLITTLMDNVSKILIVTKKGKPLDGWQSLLSQFAKSTSIDYDVINYHQVHKMPKDYDCVILDEAHNYISSYPKIPGGIQPKTKKPGIWQACKQRTLGKPIIYISATPHAQGLQMLYHQFALSCKSPWKTYKTYYAWWNHYGIPNPQWIGSRKVEKYNVVQTDLLKAQTDHLFITGTRKNLGFKQEPKDKLHYIFLEEQTKKLYNELMKERVAILDNLTFICDTPMGLRTTLHQLEGGAAKIDGSYYVLENCEKINYIKKQWGDCESVVIFYHYIAEGEKLKNTFKKAKVLQGNANAEGVDLSMYKHLIIYSQDFSTAKHTQRRARQANKARLDDITVHYLLVENAVSEQVYNTVSINKENFVDSRFEKVEL